MPTFVSLSNMFSSRLGLPLAQNEPLSPTSNQKVVDSSGDEDGAKVTASNGGIEKCELRIEGMTCGSCVESIESMLRNQDGIKSIKVALLAERGIIEYDPQLWTPEKIVNEISDTGFDATLIPVTRLDTINIHVYGMTCSSCTSTVEAGLSAMPGVCSVAISVITESATITFDRTLVGPRELIEAVENTGFDALLADAGGSDQTQLRSLTRAKEVQEWRARFRWSLVFAIPVFFLSMIAPRIPFLKSIVMVSVFRGVHLGDLLTCVLTTPAQFWLGRVFYHNAWKALKHGSATMDVLVMLGTSAAYFYSLFALFAGLFRPMSEHPFLFFDTSSMLIMFVSLGRYMENRAKGQTSAALRDLMALAPSMATIYTDAPACTTEKRVPTELVQVGDTVKLVPGEGIPADGVVVRGSSTVDESAVTGESAPVLKQPGDVVIGGTVNGLGTLDMNVTRAGRDTALAQIVRLVEEAQTSKAPIQAFADRIAGRFVPAVVSLALITFITWAILSSLISEDHLPVMFRAHQGAGKLAVCLQMCISVIVVACPCALGLSTPTAIMVGTGVGAQNGILIKGGRALEASKSIKRIVLDKTGTVTEGKMTVAQLSWVSRDYDAVPEAETESLNALCCNGVTRRADVIAMIAATEARSEHPLAKAIAIFGKDMLVKSGYSNLEPSVEAFESIPGAGVLATILLSGKKYSLRVGNQRFITDGDGNLPPFLENLSLKEEELGRTVIYVSLGSSPTSFHEPVLAVSLSDAPKASSARAIQALKDMGIEVNMMTGDARPTALAVAKQVGIPLEGVWAGVSPSGKATLVTELVEKNEGGVAMVGDGINDSPALVAATVGIALSSGTSVAIEAADIVLMRSDLLDVVAALHLSQRIFTVIRRNLIWACVYNILSIPLAMGVFLPVGLYMHPMLAGAAMAFSSVSVVTSSLTLRWWMRPPSSVMPGEVVVGETMMDSARRALGDVWAGATSWVPTGRRTAGYSQLPVELNARDTSIV